MSYKNSNTAASPDMPEAFASAVPRAPGAGRRCGLLVVISEQEERMFFPEGPLQFHGYEIERVHPEDGRVFHTLMRGSRAEVVLSAWSTPLLDEQWLLSRECPVKYICQITGSLRKQVPRAYLAKGGLASNWAGLAAPMVAEHALLLALGTLRKLPEWRASFTAAGPGRIRLRTRSLFGRRVGLHGFGRVARELVKLLKPFGTKTCAYSAGVPPDYIKSFGVAPCDSLADLFAQSQVLFECEALTGESRGCVTRALIGALPEGAVFVNVGRGQLVDESALLEAAMREKIHIALDVAASEPIRDGNPVLAAPDALISPHIGGPTDDFFPELGRFARSNLERYLRGGQPEGIVTLRDYDRAT
jgi:phosphoglycerate dehydrogenase-like enzyme